MYFEDFPYLEYDFPDNVTRLYKNLTIRPSIVTDVYGDSRNLQDYTIEDGETPETIAYKVYGDANMHWVIMLANNINSIYTDWPKTTNELYAYLADKYKNQIDSDGNAVVLTGTDLNEFIEFTGAPSNNYQSINGANVVIRPHHFEDVDGNVYSYDTATATTNKDAFGRTIDLPELIPISIYDYEADLNEKKRVIKVPRSGIAQRMRSELVKLVNE